MAEGIVIVGSSLAGLRSAEQLRSQGWEGAITLVGEEPYLPYNRPPLSKQALSDARTLSLESLHETVALGLKPRLGEVTWQLGRRAVSSDLANQRITLDDGQALSYTGLVIATGLRSRSLPVHGGESQRYRLRNLNDAWQLAQGLTEGCRITIAGAGFIGCELAATATRLGCTVNVIDAAPAPLVNVMGSPFADALLQYHQRHGVSFHLDTLIAEIAEDERGNLQTVALSNGTTIDTDILVEAIGSQPNTAWLDGNGIDITDGVQCQSDMSVPGHGNVIAVGDIARFNNPLFDDVCRRIEHWNIAVETARTGAVTLLSHLGDTPRTRPEDTKPIVPSFWSDQFDIKIQGIGLPSIADSTEPLDGSLHQGISDSSLFAMGYYRDGRLTGIISINGEKKQPDYRNMLLDALQTADTETT
ncbi:NAD(P)/FAD-dependent oxidoreductase [Chromohalobacter nigrandesensis]|uniref:NAD(P)/FAD-dependent oxidoreductase n=1 Tax=Chromohalobacter nigrandesensis TaxID=119863 RepID=UPI001FF62257|nr:FAD/NAD(P)-binding oxidoreductase [Chromohalobacter nigrandesensis]MCK0745972.1 NAD(P)/FAD-dependent oxidoreductase [Chromohalobacter nigrandesensis]